MKIFLNDTLCDDQKNSINCRDRGFLLGDGLFETCRASQGKIEFFDEHFHQLKKSAEIIKLPFPFDKNTFLEKIKILLSENNLKKNAVIRITLTRGITPRGISTPQEKHPTLLITANPCTPTPINTTAWIVDTFRRNEYSPTSQLKTLNYLDNILARETAVEKGAEDAILLNTQGKLTAGSTANLFIIKDEILYTPPIEDGIRPGIIRQAILTLAPRLKIKTICQSLLPQHLHDADEAFFTNSLCHILPLVKVNNKTIQAGNIGPVTKQLQENFLNHQKQLWRKFPCCNFTPS